MDRVAPALTFEKLQIGGNHFLDQLGECHFVAPAELGVGLARIAEQQFDFRRPEISLIDAHQRIAVLRIITDFVDARALPGDLSFRPRRTPIR